MVEDGMEYWRVIFVILLLATVLDADCISNMVAPMNPPPDLTREGPGSNRGSDGLGRKNSGRHDILLITQGTTAKTLISLGPLA